MFTSEGQLAGSHESIFDLPRPRRVRVKAIAQIIIGTLPAGSAFLFYFDVRVIRAFHQMGSNLPEFRGEFLELIFPTLMIVASSVTLWLVLRDKGLLKYGEVAQGVVTHQELFGRGRRKKSRIWYRFRSVSGQMLQGTGTDYSAKVRVDMTVPVFYRLENPARNVALCAATCELRTD